MAAKIQGYHGGEFLSAISRRVLHRLVFQESNDLFESEATATRRIVPTVRRID
jgi:hypothetical protein